MSYKVLVVDDESEIADLIEMYLQNENYTVYKSYTAQSALEYIESEKLDLAILDVMLPDIDGFQICKKIREKYTYPVIMLTAKDGEVDTITGLTLGADDYVTKPFSPKELVARIKVITKRKDVVNNIFEIEGVRLDDVAHDVYVDGKKIYLTPKEYELLKYFFDNKNIALSRENLLNHVWGFDFYGDDRTVDTHVKTLRKHLGKYKDLIVTVRGMGYKLEYEEKKEN